MSLRSRIVSLLLGLVVVYGLVDTWIQREQIQPIFEKVERAEALEDLARVERALKRQAQELATRCRRLAHWDSMHAFAGSGATAALPDLGRHPLERHGLDFLVLAGPSGAPLASWPSDEEELEHLGADVLLSDAIVLGELLTNSASFEVASRRLRSGLRSTAAGPMLMACEAISGSGSSGLPQGFVLTGQLLTSELQAEITRQTEVPFDLWCMRKEVLGELPEDLVDEVTSSADPVLREAPGEQLCAWRTLEDMRQAPGFLLRTATDRTITRSGATALSYAFNSTIAAGLLLLLALVYLLQRTVLRPIQQLTRHALEVGRTEDLFRRLDLDRDDELGILSREFDTMTERLAHSRQEVVSAARAAGMSEIATGILHNVGNVLNSVNISAAMVNQRMASDDALEDLRQVVQVLEEQGDEEQLASFVRTEQGRHLRPFLAEICESLVQHHAEIAVEASSLGSGIDHIRELIQSQQSFVGRGSLIESVEVDGLLEEALLISERAHSDDPSVTVQVDLQPMPRVQLDRHKVLEILVNLVQNARQALAASETLQRRLELSARLEAELLRIEVRDTGVGFDEATSARLFQMGFTTRSDGHGFGLHASANAARELGGDLEASSPGPGKGASFVLTIPAIPSSGSPSTT